MNLERLLEQENKPDGIVVADLFGEIVCADDIADVMTAFLVNYGREFTETIQAKVHLLFDMMTEDGWTKKRFMDTAKWIIKTRPYPTWTVSDFFNAPQTKLHTYTEYLKAVHEKGREFNSEIYKYRIGGKMYWSDKKDGLLPFELIEPVKPKEQDNEPLVEVDLKQLLSGVKKQVRETGEYLSERELDRRKQEAKMSLDLTTGE